MKEGSDLNVTAVTPYPPLSPVYSIYIPSLTNISLTLFSVNSTVPCCTSINKKVKGKASPLQAYGAQRVLGG
jgi:hypothetical protein